jgi:hypothetical protein
VREHVAAMRGVDGAAPVARGTLDLRLGATAGSTAITFDEEVDLLRATRARRGGEVVTTTRFLVATVRRAELLTTAARRRLRVEVD